MQASPTVSRSTSTFMQAARSLLALGETTGMPLHGRTTNLPLACHPAGTALTLGQTRHHPAPAAGGHSLPPAAPHTPPGEGHCLAAWSASLLTPPCSITCLREERWGLLYRRLSCKMISCTLPGSLNGAHLDLRLERSGWVSAYCSTTTKDTSQFVADHAYPAPKPANM